MIRVSKITDYAMVILTFIGHKPGNLLQASEISLATGITKPTTAKILKKLVINGFLSSKRGVRGGYQLMREPEQISILEIIQTFEGPFAIMECNLGNDNCVLAHNCSMHAPWVEINRLLIKTLESYSLSNLTSHKVLSSGKPGEQHNHVY